MYCNEMSSVKLEFNTYCNVLFFNNTLDTHNNMYYVPLIILKSRAGVSASHQKILRRMNRPRTGKPALAELKRGGKIQERSRMKIEQ